MMLRLGVDVGGTKTAAVALDASGRVAGQSTIATRTGGPVQVVETILSATTGALDAAQATLNQVISIGIGVPGQVDPQSGTVQLAVNIDVHETYPLGDEVTVHLGVGVSLENDVRTAALGAWQWLQQRNPVLNVAYLSIGTGISAGIVFDGRIYRGTKGMAGEIGHMPVVANGQRCACGSYGCLETVAAGPAIRNYAIQLNGNGNLDHMPSTAEILALAYQGDPMAQEAVDHAAAYLARAIYLLALAYDSDRIILGGGVTHAGEALWVPVNMALDRLRANSALAANLLPEERVMLLPKDYNAGAHGAVLLPQQLKWESPVRLID